MSSVTPPSIRFETRDENLCRGRNGDFAAHRFRVSYGVEKTPTPDTTVWCTAYSRRRGRRPPLGIVLSRHDALKLGLALVQAACGSLDRYEFAREIENHKHLLGEVSNG